MVLSGFVAEGGGMTRVYCFKRNLGGVWRSGGRFSLPLRSKGLYLRVCSS